MNPEWENHYILWSRSFPTVNPKVKVYLYYCGAGNYPRKQMFSSCSLLLLDVRKVALFWSSSANFKIISRGWKRPILITCVIIIWRGGSRVEICHVIFCKWWFSKPVLSAIKHNLRRCCDKSSISHLSMIQHAVLVLELLKSHTS